MLKKIFNSKIFKGEFFNKKLILLIPFFVIAILLILLPIVLILVNSIAPRNNFDNWLLVKESNTWNIILRSLKLGFIASIICLFIGIIYAYWVSKSKNKFFKIYALTLIISPLAIFTIARIYSVKGLFLALFAGDPKSLNSEWFIVVGLVYLNLPLMIMPLYSVFKDMPKNIVEASNDLGYSNFKTFFKVIIPYATKAILSGIAMIFLASATTFVVARKLLPDGSQNQLIGELINEKINPGNPFDLSSGSALVIVVSAIFIGTYLLILIVPKVIYHFKKGAVYE